ncbi:hypothetical protein LINPERPRIM_LOCUS30740 [Linum perenne]
MFIINRCF